MGNGNELSGWGVLHDYTKTVVTLSTSILALTVTFSGKLIGPHLSAIAKIMLGCIWLLLVLSITCGLLAAVFLSNYLRKKQSSEATILPANIAFISLMLSGFLFVLFGLSQVLHPRSFAERVQQLEASAKDVIRTEDEWVLKSLVCQKPDQTYEAEYFTKDGSKSYKIVTDNDCEHLLSVEDVTKP